MMFSFTPPSQRPRRMRLVHSAERRAMMDVLLARAYSIRNDKAFHLIAVVDGVEAGIAVQ